MVLMKTMVYTIWTYTAILGMIRLLAILKIKRDLPVIWNSIVSLLCCCHQNILHEVLARDGLETTIQSYKLNQAEPTEEEITGWVRRRDVISPSGRSRAESQTSTYRYVSLIF